VSDTIPNISAFIEENFGANATYVEGLLARYQANPNSVDESWQEYFSQLLNGGQVQAAQADAKAVVAPTERAETRPSGSVQKPAKIGTQIGEDTAAKPITGPAKIIVENMEQSLTVPTATSVREMPVKLLEENRRLINEHLQARGRGKLSFTHIIAWAIIKAVNAYPRMNTSYAEIDGKPARLEHESVNLGLAIDIEKKDGSRTLLVPNIKGADKMNFAQFFAEYNDRVKRARDGKLEIADFQ